MYHVFLFQLVMHVKNYNLIREVKKKAQNVAFHIIIIYYIVLSCDVHLPISYNPLQRTLHPPCGSGW